MKEAEDIKKLEEQRDLLTDSVKQLSVEQGEGSPLRHER